MTLAPKNPRSRKVRMNAVAFSVMIRVLQRKEGATYEDMVEDTGLADATVRDYISSMRRSTPRSVFIIGWEEDAAGRITVPRFRLRHLEHQSDVRQPSKKTEAERAKKYRTRKIELARELQHAIMAVTSPQRPASLVTQP